jgi:hypothetical protein
MTVSQNKREGMSDQLQSDDKRTEAEAQRDLMGDAAVDPQPLVDEEKDPIAQDGKRSNSTSNR